MLYLSKFVTDKIEIVHRCYAEKQAKIEWIVEETSLVIISNFNQV
jgi:hypothetical protein